MVALETLMKKKGSFDYIFIECDGLADPGTVASVFWLDEALESVRYLLESAKWCRKYTWMQLLR